jgi:hypothetical protein
MEAQSASMDESTYNQAVIRAVDAAAMKAADSGRDSVYHSPVDSASQAALEDSSLVGESFDTAYDEVFRNTWYAVNADADTADLLERIYVELCRIEYRDDDSDELVTDGGQEVVQAEDGSEDSDKYDLDRDNTHDLPIEVSVVSGGRTGDSVLIKETFGDGSHSTEVYTEEQGRKLFDRLKDIYGDSDGVDE